MKRVCVPAEILEKIVGGSLSYGETRIFLSMFLARESGRVGARTLSKRTKMSENTAAAALKSLDKKGIIDRDRFGAIISPEFTGADSAGEHFWPVGDPREMDEIVAGIPRNIVADMARSMRNREIERPAAYLKSLVSRYNDGRYNMIENQKCKRTEKESTKKPALRGDCVYVHEKSGRKATLSSSGDIIMRSPDDEIPRKISVEKFVKILQADPDFWREEPAAGAVPDLRGLVADLVNGVSTHVSHMGSSTH